MPTLCHSTSLEEQEEHFRLTLDVSHHLRIGASDTPVHMTGRPPPADIDITAPADFALTFSGMHQDTAMDSYSMRLSHPVRHLSTLLSTNATNFGLSAVSTVYVDDEDNISKVMISPVGQHDLECQSARLALIRLDLVYHFRSEDGHGCTNFSFFSNQPYLPYMGALDRLHDKLIAHLFRKYPLVFGPCIQRLRFESTVLRSLSRSLVSIAGRADDRQAFNKPLMALQEYHHRRRRGAYYKISTLIDVQATELAPADDLEDDVDVLALSLSQLLCLRMRTTRIKHSKTSPGDAGDSFVVKLDGDDSSPFIVRELSLSDLNWEDISISPTPRDDSRSPQNHDVISENQGINEQDNIGIEDIQNAVSPSEARTLSFCDEDLDDILQEPAPLQHRSFDPSDSSPLSSQDTLMTPEQTQESAYSGVRLIGSLSTRSPSYELGTQADDDLDIFGLSEFPELATCSKSLDDSQDHRASISKPNIYADEVTDFDDNSDLDFALDDDNLDLYDPRPPTPSFLYPSDRTHHPLLHPPADPGTITLLAHCSPNFVINAPEEDGPPRLLLLRPCGSDTASDDRKRDDACADGDRDALWLDLDAEDVSMDDGARAVCAEEPKEDEDDAMDLFIF